MVKIMNFVINVLKNYEEEVSMEVEGENDERTETRAPTEYDMDKITIDKIKTPSLYKMIKSIPIEVTRRKSSGILRDLHCISLDESSNFAFDLEAITGFKEVH